MVRYRVASGRALALSLVIALLLGALVSPPHSPLSARGSLAAVAVTPPLLVLFDGQANPFGAYLGEILAAEGVRDYELRPLADLDDALLADRRAVLLAESSPGAAQLAALDAFVRAGGGLVALRPAAGLSPILGVARQGTATGEGYIRVTDPTLGAGLYADTMQFHGTADHYALAGAAQIAELYRDRAATVGRPAATLASYGSGKAAMFAYDLARSVALTRQGNPAAADLDTDGDGIVRTTDLFRGWIDPERAGVPQADIQQRLLVRLLQAVLPQPLPRLWYFPDSAASVLVATSDAHGQPDADYQTMIDVYRGFGVRATFYLQALPWARHPAPDIVEAWRASGFDVGPHPYAGGGYGNTLDDGYAAFASWYPAVRARAERTHEIRWSGWTAAAAAEAAHGTAMDFNSYQFGDWLTASGYAGYLGGSGQPMRFVDASGAVLPIYQQHTMLVDEQVAPSIGQAGLGLEAALAVSRAAIDASVGGYHTPITTQFHVGYWTWAGFSDWVTGTIGHARQTHGLPSLNAADWLAFVEQRAATRVTNTAWSCGALTFAVASGGAGQTLLLPAQHGGATLSGVRIDGAAVSYATRVINGVSYALVPATTGSYAASYGQGRCLPAIEGLNPARGPSAGGTSVTIRGTGFAGATAVTFGGIAASRFVVSDPTTIVAVAPAHAPGIVDVQVATPGGNSPSVPVGRFTYTQSSSLSVVAAPREGGAVEGGGTYAPGATVMVAARANPGYVFTGWAIDGRAAGWAMPLAVTASGDLTIQANFAPVRTFPDVGPGRADYAAIVALATRGYIRGYGNGNYGPEDGVQRAQMAALIARAMPAGPGVPPTTLAPPNCTSAGTWDCEVWPTTFQDRNGLDGNLWRDVAALQHYGVAAGYTAGDCAARGLASPCFAPTASVSYAETIAFITRAMVTKGYWTLQPTAPQRHAGVPAVLAPEVATFHFYTQAAGGVPALSAGWNAQATRGWFAQALWRALDAYWGR